MLPGRPTGTPGRPARPARRAAQIQCKELPVGLKKRKKRLQLPFFLSVFAYVPPLHRMGRRAQRPSGRQDPAQHAAPGRLPYRLHYNSRIRHDCFDMTAAQARRGSAGWHTDQSAWPARYTACRAQFSPQTTKSACIPSAMAPTSFSTPSAQAGFHVAARIASSGAMP